jgi:hypothetical protein
MHRQPLDFEGERAHHHAIARGSALECAEILDVLALLGAGLPKAWIEENDSWSPWFRC